MAAKNKPSPSRSRPLLWEAKGSNKCGRISSGMPEPVSARQIATLAPAVRYGLSRTRISRRSRPSAALSALDGRVRTSSPTTCAGTSTRGASWSSAFKATPCDWACGLKAATASLMGAPGSDASKTSAPRSRRSACNQVPLITSARLTRVPLKKKRAMPRVLSRMTVILITDRFQSTQ